MPCALRMRCGVVFRVPWGRGWGLHVDLSLFNVARALSAAHGGGDDPRPQPQDGRGHRERPRHAQPAAAQGLLQRRRLRLARGGQLLHGEPNLRQPVSQRGSCPARFLCDVAQQGSRKPHTDRFRRRFFLHLGHWTVGFSQKRSHTCRTSFHTKFLQRKAATADSLPHNESPAQIIGTRSSNPVALTIAAIACLVHREVRA